MKVKIKMKGDKVEIGGARTASERGYSEPSFNYCQKPHLNWQQFQTNKEESNKSPRRGRRKVEKKIELSWVKIKDSRISFLFAVIWIVIEFESIGSSLLRPLSWLLALPANLFRAYFARIFWHPANPVIIGNLIENCVNYCNRNDLIRNVIHLNAHGDNNPLINEHNSPQQNSLHQKLILHGFNLIGGATTPCTFAVLL